MAIEHSLVSSMFGHLVEKLAGRMERGLRTGAITAASLFPGMVNSPTEISAVRRLLSAPSRAKNLERLRSIRERAIPSRVALARERIPEIEFTRTHEGPFSGQAILSRKPGSLDYVGKVTVGGDPRFDAAVPATVQHELSELEMKRHVQKLRDTGLDRAYQEHGAPLASHEGALANVSERHLTWGDPATTRFFDTSRTVNPDDAITSKLHRQVGYIPDRPIPLEGKQYRALVRRVHNLQSQGVLGELWGTPEGGRRLKSRMPDEHLRSLGMEIPKTPIAQDELRGNVRKAELAYNKGQPFKSKGEIRQAITLGYEAEKAMQRGIVE